MKLRVRQFEINGKQYMMVKCIKGKGMLAIDTGESEDTQTEFGYVPLVIAKDRPADDDICLGVFTEYFPRIVKIPRYRLIVVTQRNEWT